MEKPLASYRMSYRIALAGEAHTAAEILMKSCAVVNCNCVFGERSEKKLDTGQLSNNNV